jgi:hypothetical protein
MDALTARALALSCGEEAHEFAVELEVDFSVRQETRAFTDFVRDGHLTFGGDAHNRFPYSYV